MYDAVELSGCDNHGGSPRLVYTHVHYVVLYVHHVVCPFSANSERKVVKLCAAKMCLTASQQDG